MDNIYSKDMADVLRIHRPGIERHFGQCRLLQLFDYIPAEVNINDICPSITKKSVEITVSLEVGGHSEQLTLSIKHSSKKKHP